MWSCVITCMSTANQWSRPCSLAHDSVGFYFKKTHHIIFQACLALKLLLSVISHLIACGLRANVDKYIDRDPDRKITVTLTLHVPRDVLYMSLFQNVVPTSLHSASAGDM